MATVTHRVACVTCRPRRRFRIAAIASGPVPDSGFTSAAALALALALAFAVALVSVSALALPLLLTSSLSFSLAYAPALWQRPLSDI